jgi:hypothetical protein
VGDFDREVVFRGKVAVEAAMRQARALHDVGDADAVEAMLTEKGAGDLQNLLPIRRRPLACHSHGSAPSLFRLTLYMMLVINTYT